MPNCAETRLGRFEVVRELARGHDSTVYLARDPEIERTVVIKVFGNGLFSPDELASRVRSVNELSHTGIAKIFDLEFKEPDGNPFLVVEYVDGKSLEDVLAKRKLCEAEALRLTLALLKALAHAHNHGVWHHNLKPANLIVTPDGDLKVTDFAGSRRNGATPFTAPERLKGPGDERSDLFSVGVILYLMLSGFRPFQGSTEATIGFKLVHQHPVPVAAMDLEISPDLDFVVGRFLAKNPDERYQTADEAIGDIERIQKAKEAGTAAWPGEQPGGTAPDLLEALGFRNTASRIDENQRERRARRAVSLWQIGIPVGVAVAAIVTSVVLRPLMQSVPAAPVLSARIEMPLLTPIKAQPPSSKKGARRARNPVSAATAPLVANSNTTNPGIVAMPVELRQPFRECVMSIWVDEKLAYKNRIRAERKNRFLHMGTSSAEYLTLVQIPSGTHSVRVEVNGLGENYDASGSLSATFPRTNGQKLRVTADKSRPELDLQLN